MSNYGGREINLDELSDDVLLTLAGDCEGKVTERAKKKIADEKEAMKKIVAAKKKEELKKKEKKVSKPKDKDKEKGKDKE